MRSELLLLGFVKIDCGDEIHRTLKHGIADRRSFAAIPLGRYGTTEEMANAVGFLCGEESSFINGQVLAVDGGFDAAGVGLPTLRRRIAENGETQV